MKELVRRLLAKGYKPAQLTPVTGLVARVRVVTRESIRYYELGSHGRVMFVMHAFKRGF